MTLDIIVETTILVAFWAIILYFYHLKPHGVAVVLPVSFTYLYIPHTGRTVPPANPISSQQQNPPVQWHVKLSGSTGVYSHNQCCQIWWNSTNLVYSEGQLWGNLQFGGILFLVEFLGYFGNGNFFQYSAIKIQILPIEIL